jgi:predicted DNA-binding transcriptional regulator YafY
LYDTVGKRKEAAVRADRLLSLLMVLQNRGRTTTDRLAEELEVSRRTIVRDLYALRVAGFPVYTERGPHGGVYLHEEYRLKLTDLKPDELAALFTFRVPAPLDDLGMGEEAKVALRKLATSLPAAHHGVEQDVRSRLYLDPSPWHASHESVPTLSTLQKAVWENRWVRTTLLRARQIRVDHEMAPLALVAKGQTWYVIWQRRDGALRVDRVPNVLEAALTEETFRRPPDFNLEAYWAAWSAEYEAGSGFFPVTVRVRRAALLDFERDLGQRIQSTGAGSGGEEWIQVELSFDYLEHARSALLAYGGALEVIEPEALRRSIADFGQRIAEVYESAGADQGQSYT